VGAGAGGSNQDAAAGAGGSFAGAGGSSAGGTGGSASSGAVTLDQAGNPVYELLTTYASWLSTAGEAAARLAADQALADNIVTWQMPHGGFYKHDKSVYSTPWNGTDARSDWRGEGDVELGTIDNAATVTQLLFLADVYRRSSAPKYRDSARRALDFLLAMQYPSGGFPQVHPAREGTTYSNHVTFNDDAMIRVLTLFQQTTKLVPPLDGDVFTTEQRNELASSIASAVGYVLRAQITQDGAKTAWCAQHDPASYEPRGARSYELPSKSGKESANVVAFLMTQPQTPEIKTSVQAALAWFDSEAVKVANTAYLKRPEGSTDDTFNPIRPQAGSTIWYRFYELDRDVGFFSGRLPTDDPPGVGKKYDIMQIEPERRYGYEWGGGYGSKLLKYAASVGY
jgi:PelA/Pel-15E family pectate lyase